MKYFIDTEFLEGPQRHRKTFLEALLATKKYTDPTIDLISIGIVAEDGREYYAISKDFNLKEAWNRWQWNTDKNTCDIVKKVYWIRENVLKPIWKDLYEKEHNSSLEGIEEIDLTNVPEWSYNYLKYLINKYGKTNKQIAEEIKEFINSDVIKQTGTSNTVIQLTQESIDNLRRGYLTPKFYGYYADYDWVVFCWLFGRMVDLPKGFPMYCIDLKQELDNHIAKTWKDVELSTWGHERVRLENLKKDKNYPKQINEHNALADARWNKQLYEFLNTL